MLSNVPYNTAWNRPNPKFWWWFAVVCGGLPASSLVSLLIVRNSGGDLWWFAVMCGGFSGLQWFVVVCGDLRWFVF